MDDTSLWFLAALPAVLMGQIYFLGCRMSKPEKMLRPLPGLNAKQQAAIAVYKDWLASVNLRYVTCYQFGAMHVAVYQQGDLPRYLSFLFHQQLNFGVESYLEDLTILDTGNSGNSGLFPRPGAYLQSYPKISLQETWQRHLEGEAHLSQKFGFKWVPINRPYTDLFMDAVRVRMKHNRSQFLWPARVLYRYFVTRHRIVRKSIAQQFP